MNLLLFMVRIFDVQIFSYGRKKTFALGTLNGPVSPFSLFVPEKGSKNKREDV